MREKPCIQYMLRIRTTRGKVLSNMLKYLVLSTVIAMNDGHSKQKKTFEKKAP